MHILNPTALVLLTRNVRKQGGQQCHSHLPIQSAAMASIIPTIDISWFISDPTSSEATNVVSEVQRAATTCGFFQITGHGIPYAVQRDAFNAAKRFFALSLEEKKKLDRTTIPGANMRGYELLKGQQQVSAKGKGADSKEVSTPPPREGKAN